MNATVMGGTFTWGVKAEWATAPIAGIPEGGRVVRRRMRPKSVAVAFVKVGNEIRKYYLAITVTGLKLHGLAGINRKEPATNEKNALQNATE